MELYSTCLFSPRRTCKNGYWRHTAGGPREGAWLLKISSDGDDRMNVGKNQTLQKIPGPKKKPHKNHMPNFLDITQLGYAATTNLQIVLNT